MPARRSPRSLAAGFHMNCYVDDQLYVAEVTRRRGAMPSSSTSRSMPSAICSCWLARGSDEARRRRRSGGARRARGGLKARFDGPAVHLEVAAVLPRVRKPGGDEGSRLEFLAERLGFRAERDRGVRRRRERRELLEWAGSASPSRTRTRVCSRVPTSSSPGDDQGVAQVLEELLRLTP